MEIASYTISKALYCTASDVPYTVYYILELKVSIPLPLFSAGRQWSNPDGPHGSRFICADSSASSCDDLEDLVDGDPSRGGIGVIDLFPYDSDNIGKKSQIRNDEISTDFERKEEKVIDNENLKKIVNSDSLPNETTNNNINSEKEIMVATKNENNRNSYKQNNTRVDDIEIEDYIEIGRLSQQTSFEDITPLEFGEISQGSWVNCGIKSGIQNDNDTTLVESKNDVTQLSEKDLETSYPTSIGTEDLCKDTVVTKPDVVDLQCSGIIQTSDLKDKNIPEKKKSKKSGSSRTSIEMENVPGEEKNVLRESFQIPKYESLREAIRTR
jgi:hypothetical protein